MDTRAKILAVAETEFAQRGYAGAHLQAIAEAVGVQKTALYYYFPSKGALYASVLQNMLEDFDRTIRGALERKLPYPERLERLLDTINDQFAEQQNYSQILIRIFVDRADVDLSVLEPIISKVIGAILDFYRAGADAGAFRRLSARNVFQTILGATVFHYAARPFSAAVLGVEDVFSRQAVAWRREQVRALLESGVLAEGDED